MERGRTRAEMGEEERQRILLGGGGGRKEGGTPEEEGASGEKAGEGIRRRRDWGTISRSGATVADVTLLL